MFEIGNIYRMAYRPSFRQLDYIVALEELRHFGRAAARCHVSQPTLSMQVAQLEQGLGVTLFERTAVGVLPTPLGSDIAHRARIILAQLDDVVMLAQADTKRLGGLVRLGTIASLGPYFLPHFVRAVHRKHPGLKLYIREDRPVDIERAVAEGVVDCAIGPAPTQADLTFRPIGIERIWLGIPAEHPLAARETIGLADLAGLPFLSLGVGHRLSETLRQLADAAGARIVDDYAGTSLDSIRQMVSIGMGLSIFPDLYAKAELSEVDDIVLKPVTGWAAERIFGVYWRSGAGRQRHFEVLAEEARAIAVTLGLAPASAPPDIPAL
jgi:LysR family transcriptional regulator, hydrogen peroxide-inducible genes activator